MQYISCQVKETQCTSCILCGERIKAKSTVFWDKKAITRKAALKRAHIFFSSFTINGSQIPLLAICNLAHASLETDTSITDLVWKGSTAHKAADMCSLQMRCWVTTASVPCLCHLSPRVPSFCSGSARGRPPLRLHPDKIHFLSWVYSRCLRQKRFKMLKGWARYLRTLTAIQHVKS